MLTLQQAIESLQKSLDDGDKVMASKSWSGGNFKSEAVRIVLAHLATPPKS